jgi:hypothetical protein
MPLQHFKGRMLEARAALTQEPLQRTEQQPNCRLHRDEATRGAHMELSHRKQNKTDNSRV